LTTVFDLERAPTRVVSAGDRVDPRTSREKRVVSVALLDGFAVDSWSPALSPSSCARIVLYLALYGSETRNRLAGVLWPDTTQENALARLRTGLWRLRHQIPDIIQVSRGSLSLRDDVTTDVEQLMRLSNAILESDTHIPNDFAMLLRDNELTPEWHDEWITAERERLRHLRLQALDVLVDRLIAVGKHGVALQAALAALKSDPYRESSHKRVVRIHLLQGNVALARQHYATYRGGSRLYG
jgi:DNA-binding SARP family transcriptional activator